MSKLQHLTKFSPPILEPALQHETVHYILTSPKYVVLSTKPLGLAFAAHAKVPWHDPREPTHTNQWAVYIQISQTTSIRIVQEPDFSKPAPKSGKYFPQLVVRQLDHLPGPQDGCTCIHWIPIVGPYNQAAGNKGRLALQVFDGNLTVQDFVEDLCSWNPHLTVDKFGSRIFVLMVLEKVVQDGVVGTRRFGQGEDWGEVRDMKRDVKRLWPDGTDLPVEVNSSLFQGIAGILGDSEEMDWEPT
ncbi:hypothetical protein P154DRAFT_166666 [Amniculicola lignicola CBS 123094]|uniref:Uncharacterized protein n=1 Tax=Amniculicola lignicola CBS 123094 TaxID=1392246 RepID=A0A6A5WL40_9PLEO|nr:hypothetical protein P154DRAFT_166666 [Amniculicola lignicola CBS 123094]